MGWILQPLQDAGVKGIFIRSGDGVVWRIYPIFTTFVGDYPEQLLVMCCKYGDCLKCDINSDFLGDNIIGIAQDLQNILYALDTIDSSPSEYSKVCTVAGIKLVQNPFWRNLPYVNIFCSITPDILHEIHQGIIKHLLIWLKDMFGADAIDSRCSRLPPNHNLHLFSKGITSLSRVSGKEHHDICRILLGVIIDIPISNCVGFSSTWGIHAIRAILDFLYITQYPSQTSKSLQFLQDCLTHFHENKAIFIDLNIHSNSKIPKLHSLQHYVSSIQLFEMTDNYNTETSEHLHIDLAKDVYRATNREDEYIQMTQWLKRKEKILYHDQFINWKIVGHALPLTNPQQINWHTYIKMTKHPSANAVLVSNIILDYGAQNFQPECKT
jgi:Plavaka transposase